ncbi:MAG: 2Fe-2S iron-sulfur cluster-binding protein [Rhodoferax sp.]|uniref:2Fe-2S iron-sulfur cluster-binding protein n=1 Tax=Rhodoferax sp. TaxID=50421 RepID=UPI0026016491|nr:2Fe-2S iron-sulfur cluster-binding protein [Rhodoferax sp.]MDD2881244.1 2Fe-2S iron-sulfur cluster-binding protein [Rhodoferax sp.]
MTDIPSTTSSPTLYWDTFAVVFRPGETIAAALQRQGVADLGAGVGGLPGRYFCGIGTCQACLVSVNGASPVEACLTLAQDGMRLSPALLLSDAPPAWSPQPAYSAPINSPKTGATP